jgi:hypothetical protein
MLSPIDTFPNSHPESISLPTGEQLRFNTEPEIWSTNSGSIYSISPLFRNEKFTNPFRFRAFHIADAYEVSCLADIIRRTQAFIDELLLQWQILGIPWITADYCDILGGPAVPAGSPLSWIIAHGYNERDSLFDLDESGASTRHELFLSTSIGFIEVGAIGLAGRKSNAAYRLLGDGDSRIRYNSNLFGFGIGLERLVLAKKVIHLISDSGRRS